MHTTGDIYSTLYTRPLVLLRGYCQRHSLPESLYAYLNWGGATGSAKDVLAAGMLQLAVEHGKLRSGQPVVEASNGTFAAALTIAATRSGHPVYLAMPGTVMPERQRFFTDLGAQVELTNYVYGRSGMVNRAIELAEQLGGYFVNYFVNDDNPEFHRRVTGPAILKAAGEDIAALVVGVGSGGTITGVAEYLKAWAGNVWTVAVQPFESQSLTGGFAGRHGISGIGAGFVPDNYNPYIVDEVLSINTADAKEAAREVLLTDAVPAGASAGAVLRAATDIAKRHTGKVICVFNGMAVYE